MHTAVWHTSGSWGRDLSHSCKVPRSFAGDSLKPANRFESPWRVYLELSHLALLNVEFYCYVHLFDSSWFHWVLADWFLLRWCEHTWVLNLYSHSWTKQHLLWDNLLERLFPSRGEVAFLHFQFRHNWDVHWLTSSLRLLSSTGWASPALDLVNSRLEDC